MNKIFIKIISLLLIFSMVFSAFSCKKEPEQEYVITRKGTPKKVYALTFDESVGELVMPVACYGGPYLEREYHGKTLPSMVSARYFELYDKIGINLFTSIFGTDKNIEETKNFLSLCDEYNMAAFINSETLKGEVSAANLTVDKIENVLDQFSEFKSLVGFYLRDEPGVAQINSLSRSVELLKQSKYSDKLCFYNAYPCWASGEQLSGSSNESVAYEEYLRTYVEELDAKYLCYDFYPWLISDLGEKYYWEGKYIKNLSIVRKIANEYEIPYWSCKQCGAVQANKNLDMLKITPNQEEFRWQMSIDLAYGVKGFNYFLLVGHTLGYNSRWSEGIDDYYGLFNSYTGELNVWGTYAEEFKEHLQVVDEVLINACHEGVIAHGDVIEKEFIGDELIESGRFKELLSVDGDASLIGCFDYKGGTALYVTNNSYENKAEVKLNFADNYGYNVYQGKEKTFKTGRELAVDLKEGEGVLVVLE